MPITKTMAYRVGDETFPTLESAQISAIGSLFEDGCLADLNGASLRHGISKMILEHANAIIDILTYQPDEEDPPPKKIRKPRSDKGKKRAKDAAINRALQDGKQ